MTSTATAVKFSSERVAAVWPEIYPLFEKHWNEIAHFKDIPLDPDVELYNSLDDLGIMRVFTARDDGKLIGYSVYFVGPHIHFRKSIHATQDVFFINKENRGFGMRFLRWCDDELRRDGVQVVINAVSQSNDYSPVLRRMGYKESEKMFCRRLF